MRRVALYSLFALGGLIALAVIAFVLLGGVYRAPSESMEPTIHHGDRFAVLKVGTPAVGDVVVFHAPLGGLSGEEMCGDGAPRAGQMCAIPAERQANVKFVKRIVAEGGDKISMRDGRIIRNGKRETTDGPRACDGVPCNFAAPVEVPAGHFFMLGDNRGASDDSRFWGPVPEDWVIGRYWFGLG